LKRTALRAALLPVRFFTEPMGDVTAPAAIGAVAFALIVILAWRRREMLLWALWLWLTVLPIVALDLSRKTQHLEFIRYTLLASPAVYALVAAALSDSSRRLRHLSPALALIACFLALPAAYSTWWKADWRRFAREIDAAARPSEPVIFWRGGAYALYPNDAYRNTSYYRRKPCGPIVLLTEPPAAAMIERIRAWPSVLVIAPTDDVEVAVPGATLTRITMEPAAGEVWRATFADK
jgi:hypothetical protein